MTVITAYLLDRTTGRPSGIKGAESNLLPRPAIAAWAREVVGGWWHLKKQGTEFMGHQLWLLWRAETETMVAARWKIVTTMRRSRLRAPSSDTEETAAESSARCG